MNDGYPNTDIGPNCTKCGTDEHDERGCLLAATERVRRAYACKCEYYEMLKIYGRCDIPGGRIAHIVDDLHIIARAYLALVPADDDVAIDEAWLKSVSLRFSEEMFAYQFPLGSRCSLWVRCYKGKPSWWLSDTSFAGGRVTPGALLKTRGDVRRLASVLGITLTEGT